MSDDINKRYVTPKHLWYIIGFLACLVLGLGLFLPHPYYLATFAVPVAVVTIVLIFARPFVGLILYSVLFLVRPHEFVGFLVAIPFPLERILGMLMIIIVLIKIKFLERSRIELGLVDYGILGFLLASLLSVPFSIWVGNSMDTWIKLLRLFIVYFLICQLVDSQKRLRTFILLIIFSSVFHAAASVVNYYRGIVHYAMGIERAMGLDTSYGMPNSLAATLVYTLPFVVYVFWHFKSRLMKAVLAAGTAIMLWCIILTGSRTGMVGTIFVIMMIVWYGKNRVRNFAVGLIFLAIVVVVMPDQYKARFLSITDVSSETGAAVSARGRLDGFINGLKMFMDRPVLGYGIGNFGVATGLVYESGWLQAHSLPGQMLGEVGVLGSAAFVVWIYFVFRILNQVLRRAGPLSKDGPFMASLAISLKVQLFSLLFMGLGGHNLYRYNWFIISAIAVVMLRFIKETEQKAVAPVAVPDTSLAADRG